MLDCNEARRREFFRRQGYASVSCHVKSYLHTIYEATRLADGQRIAIKLLSPDNAPEIVEAYHLERDEMIRKFHREVRVLSRVKNNPGMPTIVDAGEINGMPYHVCRWVEGQSVLGLLTARGNPLTLKKKLFIVLRAGRSIQELHEQRLVHRDVAPDHVYVTSEHQTCIIDFGMSEFLDENLPQDAKRYIGHDVFSTGLVLYEMWVGKRVFAYGHPMLSDEVIRVVRRLQARSRHSPVGDIVKHAMVCDESVAARAPGDYEPYRDMAAFVSDLERLVADDRDPARLLPP